MYKVVTGTVMVLLETYLINASLCHDISVPIRQLGYRLGTKRCFVLNGIRTNQQRTNR